MQMGLITARLRANKTTTTTTLNSYFAIVYFIFLL